MLLLKNLRRTYINVPRVSKEIPARSAHDSAVTQRVPGLAGETLHNSLPSYFAQAFEPPSPWSDDICGPKIPAAPCKRHPGQRSIRTSHRPEASELAEPSSLLSPNAVGT